MQIRSFEKFHKILFTALLLCLSLSNAKAQPAGLLYDPEPPADSAYVRVILATRDGPVDILVDGRSRIRSLGVSEFSDYMVLNAGKRTISIHPAGKSVASLSTSIDVIRGKAMTVAFTALKADKAPIVFEDKANTNKLKVQLAVYHLDEKAGPLDVLTADGNTKVFSGVTYGASASLQVNPISIELIAAKGGDKQAQARTSLSMTQGGTYSILLSSGGGGKLVARTAQNKIERYTGK
jgi:alginate O-acetyltransferase complex protein AlgF